MRTVLLNLGLMGVLFGVWYSHAPIDHKMRVPTEVRQTVAAFDNLASASVFQLTAMIDERAHEPIIVDTTEAGPLLIGASEEGVDVHRQLGDGLKKTAPLRHPEMFAGLSLKNATLAESRLDGFTLDFTDLRGAAIINASIQKASGQDARFDDAFIHRTDFSRGSLRRARFDRAVIAHSMFEGAEIIEGSFAGVIMRGGSLSGATVAGSRFDGARFEHTDLRQVDFGAASFRDAEFISARLHGSSLAASDFSGADLSHAIGLTQHQLDQACGTDQTRLPEGLSIPLCAEASQRLAQK